MLVQLGYVGHRHLHFVQHFLADRVQNYVVALSAVQSHLWCLPSGTRVSLLLINRDAISHHEFDHHSIKKFLDRKYAPPSHKD